MKITLPESLMKSIRVIGRTDTMEPMEKLKAAVLISHGYRLYAQQESIDPTETVIPSEQWKEICQILIDVSGPDINRVNLSLSWMNVGASSWEETDGSH
jgi:hypothetical protein